jgi:DNA replication and repair protein RecF
MIFSKLNLHNFRNFQNKNFDLAKKIILIYGDNGVGKTNILESLTLLGKGPTLRNSDFDNLLFIDTQQNLKFDNLVVSADFIDNEAIEKIAINYCKSDKKKKIYINGEVLTSKKLAEYKNYLPNIIFLTPKLEQLFINAKSDRRDYLDKIVCDIDANHQSRINNYQKLIKERLLIMAKNQQKNIDKWLDIVENKIVEIAIAIASARVETIDYFNRAISSFSSNFPKIQLKIIGDFESQIMNKKAVEIESFYLSQLQKNRESDLRDFKTNFGIHRSDFSAIWIEKNIEANNCSTGEQKSIMISITLARAKISSEFKKQPTILIFDEIFSHLDQSKKQILLDEIIRSNIQTFFTSTNSDFISQNHPSINEIKLIEL